MSDVLRQTVFFAAAPEVVYEALMDSEKHAAFTNSQAGISREVGGEFMAYGGYITGRNLELLPGRRIVQEWRAMDWDESACSIVTFEFSPHEGGARLDFTHSDLPEGTEEEFSRGWIDNYWEPLKRYLLE